MKAVVFEKYYTGQDGTAYQSQKHALPAGALSLLVRARGLKVQQHVKPGDVVMEFGVGAGWNLGSIVCRRKLAYDVTRTLEPTLATDVEFSTDLSHFEVASVDVMVCHHVLEHVPHPYGSLEYMFNLLRSGGRLLLFVPFETGSCCKRYDPADSNHHVYSWNVQTLATLATAAGFRVKDIRLQRFGYDCWAAAMVSRLSSGFRLYMLLRRLMLAIRPVHEICLIALKP